MKFWAVDLAHYFLNGHPHLSSKKYVHDRISGQTLVCVVPITIFRAGKVPVISTEISYDSGAVSVGMRCSWFLLSRAAQKIHEISHFSMSTLNGVVFSTPAELTSSALICHSHTLWKKCEILFFSFKWFW